MFNYVQCFLMNVHRKVERFRWPSCPLERVFIVFFLQNFTQSIIKKYLAFAYNLLYVHTNIYTWPLGIEFVTDLFKFGKTIPFCNITNLIIWQTLPKHICPGEGGGQFPPLAFVLGALGSTFWKNCPSSPLK